MLEYTEELPSTMRMSLATLIALFKMLCETWKFLLVEDHLFWTIAAEVLEVYLTATHANEPSVINSIGT
jgi:hypothetical protein